MNFFSILFQCGLFTVPPIATFIFGIWLIQKHFSNRTRLASALLIGIIFFEASMIGMSMDPKSANVNLLNVFLIAGTIGIAASLFVFILLPIGMAVLRIFNKQ